MKGDFSRIRFDKEKHYSEVLMQQGRVSVDADWNEQQAINQHRIETEALDIIGDCGAPENNAGFKITANGITLNIGRGRYYVDGILCENDSDGITYDKQPDLPDPPDILKILENENTTMGLVYLDAWKWHITALDDPLIREVALSGPDTTTRVKTVWQVKILPIKSTDGPVNCDSQFPEWDKLVTASTGTLNARTQPPGSTDNPCLLPPNAGYQRLENQLYRIEIHKGGSLGTATFKWSRDNGSVVTAIEKISNQEVTVHDVGPDDALGFASGQWAEVVDDITELNGRPGQIIQIDKVDPATRVITLKSSPTAVDMAHHPKLRRWDSAGEIKVEVPASNNGWISIEGGIEVLFSTGNYNTGDYWMIPARTVTGEIEWPPYEIPNINPISQPSLGIQHHYCRLAIIQRKTEDVLDVQDCRKIFPPLTGAKEPGIHVLKVLAGDYLFSWDDIPGNDNERLIGFLKKRFNIEWAGNAKIEKIEEGKTITLSFESNFLSLKLNADKTKVSLKIDDGRTNEFIAKTENNKLNIYTIDKPLRNDTEILVKTLTAGLHIEFDEDIDPSTVRGKPTCFVTLDMPFPFNDVDRGLWGSLVAGFQPLILDADVKAEGNVVRWEPMIDVKNWLQKLLDMIIRFKRGDRVLAHLTLKGNFIWAKDNPELYLDGEVFGFREADGNNTDIHLPSGDGRRGGDFEIWFWLVPPGSISGFKINSATGNKIPGWKIILKDSGGTEVARTTTNADGFYIFNDLEPGTYIVEEVNQVDWRQTAPTPIPPGTHTLTLAAGKNMNVTGKDFGNVPTVG